jgi:hypothetical protein
VLTAVAVALCGERGSIEWDRRKLRTDRGIASSRVGLAN